MSTAQAAEFNRAEWLESRKRAIGASDAAAVLGISPFASEWEVWAEKTNRLEPWKGDKSTRAGVAFENAVLDAAEKELGPLERNVRLVHSSLPIAATLDGRVIANGRPVEAKTTGIVGPNFGTWGDSHTDEVPDYYLVQVHTQLLVTGAQYGYLYALIAGRGVVPFIIERDDNFLDWLGNQLNDWWHRHVVADLAPKFDSPRLDVVKRLRKWDGKRVSLGEDVASLCEQWRNAADAKLAAEKEADGLQARILLALDDATEADLPGGASLVSKEVTVKAQVRDEYTYRRLYYKKAK